MKGWMASNRLKLNPDKTEFLWTGSRKRLMKLNPSDHVLLWRDGVTLNFDLLTQKRNQVICVPRCTSDKRLAKIRQQQLYST